VQPRFIFECVPPTHKHKLLWDMSWVFEYFTNTVNNNMMILFGRLVKLCSDGQLLYNCVSHFSWIEPVIDKWEYSWHLAILSAVCRTTWCFSVWIGTSSCTNVPRENVQAKAEVWFILVLKRDPLENAW